MSSPAPSSPLSSLSDYPEDTGSVEISDEAAMLSDLQAAYARGAPLFQKAALAAAAKAIASNAASVELPDVLGALRRHAVQYSAPAAAPHIPLLHYHSYEALTQLAPFEHADRPSALTIHWRAAAPPPTADLAALRAAFRRHAAAWAATCARAAPSLTQLVAAARPLLAGCTVLCLGLGSPAAALGWMRTAEARCFAQHAAVVDVAAALAPGGDGRVRVLAQDPAYCEADVALLAELGIQVVEDPQGFLELDDRTFVVSVACNVPQKQIVADLARPVAMLWNEVEEEDEVERSWEQRPDGVYVAYVAACAGAFCADY